MRRPNIARRLGVVVAAAAAAGLVFTGGAAAAPDSGAAIDWNDAALHLRDAARGNPAAEAAVDRLIAGPKNEVRQDVALPAQVFQVPAQSDIGRGDPATGQLYGSGIALGIGGFRFGFFGGPGTIAPNQTGAKLEVVWFNLSNGRSGTEVLNEHNDIPVDTTIRTADVAAKTGPGTIVAAVYGSLWHRYPVPVSDQHKDGFAYQKGTIWFPSLGAVQN